MFDYSNATSKTTTSNFHLGNSLDQDHYPSSKTKKDTQLNDFLLTGSTRRATSSIKSNGKDMGTKLLGNQWTTSTPIFSKTTQKIKCSRTRKSPKDHHKHANNHAEDTITNNEKGEKGSM